MEHQSEIIKKIDEVGQGINKRLDVLNGTVAKHTDKFGTQDVLNAQMTLTQQQLVTDLNIVKTEASKSSEFRTEARATINVFKWLIGAIGIGTIINIISTLK